MALNPPISGQGHTHAAQSGHRPVTTIPTRPHRTYDHPLNLHQPGGPMRHHALATATATILTLAALTACDPAETTSSGPATANKNATASSGKTAGETKTVPNFVGMGLQSAQDAAQKAGFYNLESHDSLGRDRMQILDRDWKVCSQNVKAGSTASTDIELNFGTVKLSETCPAKDQAAPSVAGGKMPDFRGKSVKAARSALDSGTSITVKDASGDGRFILVESNWQVCSQSPAAGAKLNGQPVTLTAVKFDESCP